jgi:hypothetical protein
MTTVADVINWTREEVLDDTDAQKYLWSDTELIHHLNRCYNELIKAALPQKDQSTVAITQIKLLSNLGLYALDSRIIQVETARLQSDTTFGPLNKTTENRLNGTVSNWRNETGTPREYAPGAASGYLSIYPKFDNTCEYIGSSNISFVSGTKTISQVGGNFSGLVAGDQVVVTGSGVTANNTTLTVVTVGTTSFTVSEAITTALNTSATIRKVRDTLLMSVSRLPTARWTVQDITDETVITEIRDDHIDGLMDGIAKRAFLKPDTYAYYPQKAEYHRGLFEEFKKEVRRDMILLHKPAKSRVPRSGTSIFY